MSFNKKSYQIHQEHLSTHFASSDSSTLRNIYEKTDFKNYISGIFYDHLMPLLRPEDSWFTVGDTYGTDAKWLSSCCKEALPTDIGDTFLIWAKQEGYIQSFSQQNAEQITFDDNSFDYAYCREAFHHFPRPYMAVYEMLRCAKKAVVFNEPADPYMQMPFRAFLCNLLDTKKNPIRSSGIWKNRFSFEVAGNYVYKISQREFEKIAMGLGLPAVAFYYSNLPLHISTLKKLKRRRLLFDFLSKLNPHCSLHSSKC